MHKLLKQVSCYMLPLTYLVVVACQSNQRKNHVIFTFDHQINRIWLGPDFWANRLQDWKLENGKIVCTTASPNRNLHLLTRRPNDKEQPFEITVELGFLNEQKLPDAAPYPGWPVIIAQEDNYARKPIGYLTEIQVTGLSDPVLPVIREDGNEIVYTLRINGTSFRPMVFEEGNYTLKAGDPDREMKIFKGLEPGEFTVMEINF